MKRVMLVLLLLTVARVINARPAINAPRAAFKLPTQQQLRWSYNTNPGIFSLATPPTFPVIFPAVVRAHTGPIFHRPQDFFSPFGQSQMSGQVIRAHSSPLYQEPQNAIEQQPDDQPFVVRAHSSPLYIEPQNSIYFEKRPQEQQPSMIRAHSSPLYQEPQNSISSIEKVNQIPAAIQSHGSPLLQMISKPIFPSIVRAHTTPLIQGQRASIIPSKILYSPVISQTRSQDEKGGYHFSYSGGPTSRTESRDHQGVVRGAYSYVDPNGQLQSYKYIADKGGFRVTNNIDSLPSTPAKSVRILQIPELIIARRPKMLDTQIE